MNQLVSERLFVTLMEGKEYRRVPGRRAKHGSQLVFFYTVDSNGCWITSYNQPYPVVIYDGKKIALHRLVYLAFVGEIEDRMDVDHECRNGYCIHPLHLRQLTRADNTKYGVKGRKGFPGSDPWRVS